MDKRILIPTDFSKNALNAARYALSLYEGKDCEIFLLNIFRLNSYKTDSLIIPEPGSAAFESSKAASEEGFAKLLDILRLHHTNPRHRYHTISTFNFLSEALKETIASKDIDLVVMGTQGATGSKGVIFGSNTVMAMEKIRECPILAVPEGVRFTPPKEIVFPTDYKDPFKKRELNYLIEIAKMHDTAIRILHIKKEAKLSKEQENQKELLADLLRGVNHSFHNLSDIEIAKGISTFVKSRESDMIAFINRKHFFFNSVFSKPLVKEIGYHATTPILALH